MKKLLALYITLSLLAGCNPKYDACEKQQQTTQWQLLLEKDCTHLSAYGLFDEHGNASGRYFDYQLNVALYSDYADKYRSMHIPPGKKITVLEDSDTLDFPVGSVLTKTFMFREYAGQAASSTNNQTRIETRLLIKGASGWRSLIYLWNSEQSDALISEGDVFLPIKSSHQNQPLDFLYLVPAKRYCFDCHQNNTHIRALGPTIKNLNLEYLGKNQITALIQQELMEPLLQTPNVLPKLPSFSNFSSLDFSLLTNAQVSELASAYLDVNCGSCHEPIKPGELVGGMASIFSGINLTYLSVLENNNPFTIGACRPLNIIAHLFGTTNTWAITPGKPESSAIIERMQALPGLTRMPAIGSRVPHKEGIALLSQWIDRMPDNCTESEITSFNSSL